MFVWPHKMILKTCGTTTLLLGMDRLLEIARKECGLKDTYRCFYSRKAFMFPERQVGPHRHWDEEVKVLDSYFGRQFRHLLASIHSQVYHRIDYYHHPQAKAMVQRT